MRTLIPVRQKNQAAVNRKNSSQPFFCINNETHMYTLSRRFVVYEKNCFFLPAAPCGSCRIKAPLF